MPQASQQSSPEAVSNTVIADQGFKADHISLFKEENVVHHIEASSPDLRIMYVMIASMLLQRD
jgi:hypothetical protein